ncbi:hypothetical protein AB6A40_010190 [Gnathostoma spinigerum]|uniref:Uncharacterized protein n=1 Tax=Gnathostoma spinigerum TaxID=75299 RepID=A0ABD6EUF0_9BILA
MEFIRPIFMKRCSIANFKEAERRRGLDALIVNDDHISQSLCDAKSSVRLQFNAPSVLSSPDRPSNLAHHRKARTLPSSLDRQSGTGSAGEIEMTPMGTSASVDLIYEPERFSFVSLDTLQLKNMDSDHDSSCTSEDAAVSEASSRAYEPSPSSKRHSDDAGHHRINTEVWTWGANSNGQLGQNDLIHRRTPSRVGDLCHINCVKISAGDEHSAALSAAGELYVWGSNGSGQLKQSDQTFITYPSLFRVIKYAHINLLLFI